MDKLSINFLLRAGVQIDAKISPTGEDLNWSSVWKSSVSIIDNGWIAEIAIPFSSLRFANNSQSWALNLTRNLRRNREVYSWNPINVSYQNRSLQSGLLEGISNIETPLRLSFILLIDLFK